MAWVANIGSERKKYAGWATSPINGALCLEIQHSNPTSLHTEWESQFYGASENITDHVWPLESSWSHEGSPGKFITMRAQYNNSMVVLANLGWITQIN